MAQMPDLKIKGRLVFRPNEGDTEHDLGEVEFTLAFQPQPSAPVKRGGGGRGVGGTVLPTGPTAPSGISPSLINGPINPPIATAVRGVTTEMNNGR